MAGPGEGGSEVMGTPTPRGNFAPSSGKTTPSDLREKPEICLRQNSQTFKRPHVQNRWAKHTTPAGRVQEPVCGCANPRALLLFPFQAAGRAFKNHEIQTTSIKSQENGLAG